MTASTQEAPDINFEYYTHQRVDANTAWDLARIEAPARAVISELYELVPPADSPNWVTGVLGEQAQQVMAHIAQITAETNKALQAKEFEVHKVLAANQSLDTFFSGRTWFGQVIKETPWYDEKSERARGEATKVYEEVVLAFGKVKEGVLQAKYNKAAKPEPIAVTLFDNSDNSDMEGGRQGADVLLGLKWLDHGFDRDEVLEQLKRNFKTEDGVITSDASFRPRLYDSGPTSCYTGGNYIDSDIDYTLRYETAGKGNQRVTLEVAQYVNPYKYV